MGSVRQQREPEGLRDLLSLTALGGHRECGDGERGADGCACWRAGGARTAIRCVVPLTGWKPPLWSS